MDEAKLQQKLDANCFTYEDVFTASHEFWEKNSNITLNGLSIDKFFEKFPTFTIWHRQCFIGQTKAIIVPIVIKPRQRYLTDNWDF